MTTPLAETLVLPCGLTLPDRLVKSAMTECLADANGRVTPELVRLYETWAAGEIGTQITGNVMVDKRYLESAGNLIIDPSSSNQALAGFSELATAAKRHGGKAIMQLSHSGRQTPFAVCDRPVAPSAVPLQMPGRAFVKFGHPRALTSDEVDDVVLRFANAAIVAEKSGFDGVQIHAAHGYLISQFLSPQTNRRTDKWGGTLENRARLLLEVIRAVRAEVGSGFAVGVKLNSADFQHGGFTHEDCLNVVDWLNAEAVDFIEVSGGNYEQPQMMGADIGQEPESDGRLNGSTIAREAYFVAYAKSVRARARMPVLATGGFRTKFAMEEALSNGLTDLIGLARPLCCEPDLPKRLKTGKAEGAVDFVGLLKLGPGKLFGPSSGLSLMRALNVWSRQAWYLAQIRRLGEGREPDVRLGLFSALSEVQGETARRVKTRNALEL